MEEAIIDRYLHGVLKSAPTHKIILISGPRQVGKTTIAKSLVPDHEYLNWDNLDHREIILSRSWSRSKSCVIFDELHKMPQWKGWLKGIYDVEKVQQRHIVTGSARLNAFRRVGDSLAGRFFSFTLHPFDLKEASQWFPDKEASSLLTQLLTLSGFPEPFLKDNKNFYKMWRRSHLDVVLRHDLIDLKTVHEIGKVELLIEHLRKSVGSPISFHSIGEDLQVSDNTVRAWIGILEDLYIIFRISPYSKNVKRAVLKAPKIYFYDYGLVNSNEGGVFENLIACALLKEVELQNESGAGEYALHYLRNKDGAEIDFLIVKDDMPHMMVEAKVTEDVPSKHFKTLGAKLPGVKAFQIVKDLSADRDYPFGVSIRSGANWLRNLDIATNH